MVTRLLVLLILLSTAVFVTFSLPSAAMEKKASTDCTQPDYEQVTVNGACWLYEYCDGVLVEKIPISDSPCQ